MQLAMLKQLKLKNMITEEEYEKILRAIRKDYQVISDISPWQNKCATVYMHVESVVLLSQQKPDDVIEVEIELDELEDAGILARLVWSDLWIDLRMRHREWDTGILRKWDVIHTKEHSKREYQFNILNINA